MAKIRIFNREQDRDEFVKPSSKGSRTSEFPCITHFTGLYFFPVLITHGTNLTIIVVLITSPQAHRILKEFHLQTLRGLLFIEKPEFSTYGFKDLRIKVHQVLLLHAQIYSKLNIFF